MPQPNDYLNNVFVNCPFDAPYHSMFEATIFTIHDCGFIARCAREENDSGNVRIMKIIKIIDECRYGLHDISKADVDPISGLARFNMPLELGLFLGAKNYAPARHYNKDKKVLILDTEQFRYQQFISDLAGQDIAAHGMAIPRLIAHISEFLDSYANRSSIPGGAYINGRFENFLNELPNYCATLKWDRNNLTYKRYVACVIAWIDANAVS